MLHFVSEMSYKGPWVGGASATVCDLARCCEFQNMNACEVTYVIGDKSFKIA